MSERVRYENRGEAAWIVIDNPDHGNSFAANMREELAFALDRAKNDPVRVVVIAGEGDNFSSGGDLRQQGFLASAGDLPGFRRLAEAGSRCARMLLEVDKPVIAAVDGEAVGVGCVLAAACDIVISTQRASFRLESATRGIVPGWGGTFFLPARIGARKTWSFATAAGSMSSDRALEIGMVDQVVEDDRLEATVEAECQRLAKLSQTSLTMHKQLLSGQANMELEEALAREWEAFATCFESEGFPVS